MRVTRPSGPALFLAAACLIQTARILAGIDFSDEMQYYGEILALQGTGRLFTADLFVQQTVYLLFYPLLKAQALLFDTAGLVLFGRTLLACVILWMYGMVRRTLVRAGVPPETAACSALAVTFAVPYHNIYAPSYNTIAQVLAAVCAARFLLWRRQGGSPGTAFWASSCATLLLVYPTLGLAISLIVALRLVLDRDFRTLRKIATCGALALLAAGLVVVRSSTPVDLAAALEFSGSFGIGSLWTRGKELRTLAVILGVIAGAYCFRHPPGAPPPWGRDRPGWGVPAAVLLAALGFASGVIEQRTYWPTFLTTTIVALCGCLLALRRAEPEGLAEWRWTTLFFLVIGLTLAATSGNGLRQFAGAAMLAAPLYFALASRPSSGAAQPGLALPAGLWVYAAGLLAVFTALWISQPYRDGYLWQMSGRAPDVPAYRHLRLSREKAEALRAIRSALSDIPAGSRAMVIGGHPWIYFATLTRPETPMVYMHHHGPARSFEILARRIPALRPEYVIVAGKAPDAEEEAVRDLLREGRYTCEPRRIDASVAEALSRQTQHHLFPTLTLCRSPAASG